MGSDDLRRLGYGVSDGVNRANCADRADYLLRS